MIPRPRDPTVSGRPVDGPTTLPRGVCHDVYSAHQCVEHDNVNVICMGAWIIGIRVAEEILATYLKAEFSTSEEFRRRVRKIGEMEKR